MTTHVLPEPTETPLERYLRLNWANAVLEVQWRTHTAQATLWIGDQVILRAKQDTPKSVVLLLSSKLQHTVLGLHLPGWMLNPFLAYPKQDSRLQTGRGRLTIYHFNDQFRFHVSSVADVPSSEETQFFQQDWVASTVLGGLDLAEDLIPGDYQLLHPSGE